eukprot:9039252-Pyramimonas_sp.AAC.1
MTLGRASLDAGCCLNSASVRGFSGAGYPAQVMVLVTGLAVIASYSWRLLGSFGCPAAGSDGVWSFVQCWDYLVMHG